MAFFLARKNHAAQKCSCRYLIDGNNLSISFVLSAPHTCIKCGPSIRSFSYNARILVWIERNPVIDTVRRINESISFLITYSLWDAFNICLSNLFVPIGFDQKESKILTNLVWFRFDFVWMAFIVCIWRETERDKWMVIRWQFSHCDRLLMSRDFRSVSLIHSSTLYSSINAMITSHGSEKRDRCCGS